MSLAQLFGLKETWRQRMKRARHEWFRSCHNAFEVRHRAPVSQFSLEMLEPRLLLNAAPVIEAITQEAVIASAQQAPSPLVLLDGDATALEQPNTGAEVNGDSKPASRHEVVFIDEQVHDAQPLISGVDWK
jgi:hypothetical protein